MNRSFLLLITLLSVLLINVNAKDIALDETLPVDPKVKIGKLDNGFTYYIRYNAKPEKRVEMRLAVNAGSILEDEEQQGLAHFTEHMAFNGSEHFEKNELISYLQKIGVEFGPDLNAYTSFDETVYKLSIPSDSIHLVDKGFLVMEDWAHGLNMAGEEIDKERGVIIEEWRMRNGAMQRMMDQFYPVLFDNSLYAQRLPIGQKEILDTFHYDAIRRFYDEWYRPDLMAFVLVGDIDVDYAEKKIIEHFSKIEMPSIVRERKYADVPDHKDTKVSVAIDKEARYNMIRLYYKKDKLEESTGEDYLRNLSYNIFTGMLNLRLRELTELAEPPFVQAGFGYGGISRTKDAYYGYAIVTDNNTETGLKTILAENERIRKFGFTQGELNRYKMDILKRYEKYYSEKDKTESNRLIDEYVRNYLNDEPIPGIEVEYELVKNHLDDITLENINKLCSQFITDENRVIGFMGPEKVNLDLKKEQLLAWADEVGEINIEPYEDKLAGASLLAQKPEKGIITEKETIESIDAEKITLSNGVIVYLKKTDFKNDEIILRATSKGGTSLYPDEDYYSAIYAEDLADLSGVSEFSNSDLTKLLAGKSVSVNAQIGKYSESIGANCRPVDLETMFQLIYLSMTNPRKDEEVLLSYKNRMAGFIKNIMDDPQYYYSDQSKRFLYKNHPRVNYIPELADFEKIDFDRSMEIYKERFSDANDFTFFIIGAIDKEEIYSMLETYIASLPVKDSKEDFRDLNIRPLNGYNKHAVYKGADEKSITQINTEKEAEFNKEDAFMLIALSEVIQIRYYELLREEMSGVYGVRANVSFNREPYERVNFSIRYPSAPENVDSLAAAAWSVIKDIQENGVEEEYITKVKNTLIRGKEKNMEKNGYWLGQIMNCAHWGYDFAEINDYGKFDKITSEALKEVAQKYIDTENYTHISLYPEAMKPE